MELLCLSGSSSFKILSSKQASDMATAATMPPLSSSSSGSLAGSESLLAEATSGPSVSSFGASGGEGGGENAREASPSAAGAEGSVFSSPGAFSFMACPTAGTGDSVAAAPFVSTMPVVATAGVVVSWL